MKSVDRILTFLSWIIIFASSVDTILNGLKLVPVILALLLIMVSISLYYLTKNYKPVSNSESKIVDHTGKVISTTSNYTRLAINVNRVFLAIGCIGIIMTLTLQRSIPSLNIEIDKIENFEIIEGNKKTVYTTAGEKNGIYIYGRGQQLLITLTNNASMPLDVISINLRLISLEKTYNPALKYDKLQFSVPCTRLPVEQIKTPVQWDIGATPGTLKTLGEGRIKLGPKGTQNDTHQIQFTVEAKSAGLWTYQLEVVYNEPRVSKRETVTYKNNFMILLRGK
jgi:hypothetical protein